MTEYSNLSRDELEKRLRLAEDVCIRCGGNTRPDLWLLTPEHPPAHRRITPARKDSSDE